MLILFVQLITLGDGPLASKSTRRYRQFERLQCPAETVTPRGRVAQLGEHLLCN